MHVAHLPLECEGSTTFSCLSVWARGTLGMGGGLAACALVELECALVVPLSGTLSFIQKRTFTLLLHSLDVLLRV
jgi:hypothetical protein